MFYVATTTTTATTSCDNIKCVVRLAVVEEWDKKIHSEI